MKKTILVCDDDDGILDVVTIILNEMGYKVIALCDSEEVLTFVEHSPPDLILLDLWMPNISGEELTVKLKKNIKSQLIPIIIISASKDTEKIASDSGADDCLIKPFDIEELENMVKKYIN